MCIIFQTCWTTCDKRDFEEVIGLSLPFVLAIEFCVWSTHSVYELDHKRGRFSINMPSYQYIDRGSIPRREPLVTTQPRRTELIKTKVDFISKAFIREEKNPKHRGSKISQMSNLQSEYRKENHVLSIWRRDSEWHSGVSNQYEYSRIRNFGAKSIRFVSWFTENIIEINAFIRHNSFIHIRHSSITLIGQTTIY